MALSGKYLLYDEENFVEHVKSVGIDLKGSEGKKNTLEIKQDGNKYTLVRTIGDDSTVSTFSLNEPFVENFLGTDVESTATLENNVLKITTTGGRQRYYNVSDKGLEVLIKFSKGQATLKYKRI